MELPSDIPKTTINMQHVLIIKGKPQFYYVAFKMQNKWIKQLLEKVPYCGYFTFLTLMILSPLDSKHRKKNQFPKFIHFTNMPVSNIPGVGCLDFISLGSTPDLTKQPTPGNT